MPKKKGIKATEETKAKMVESWDKKTIKQEEDTKQLRKLETKLIEKEYKNNMAEHIEQRLFDLKYALKHILDENYGIKIVDVDKLIRGKNLIGSPSYSAEELSILFAYYREFVREINKVSKYIPTKKNFCAFAGISSSTYDNYMIEGDQQKIETMKMIDDYITDISLTMAQNREIDNVTTIYRSKAEHGMVEAVAPIVVKHEADVNIDEIKETIRVLKSGKSLKTIELSGDDYKIQNEE